MVITVFFFTPESSEYAVEGINVSPGKRWNSMMEAETRVHRLNPKVILSQPLPARRPPSLDQLVNDVKIRKEQICFSQPIQNEHLILGSQIQFAISPITKDNFDSLIKRMTRFYVTTDYQNTLEILGSILDTLHYCWQIDGTGAVCVLNDYSREYYFHVSGYHLYSGSDEKPINF